MLLLAGLVPVIVILALLALLAGFRTAYQGARIVSSSMEPTLRINDKVLFDKVTYQSHDPQRRDIVLYYPPQWYEKRRDDLPTQLGKATGLPFFPAPVTYVHRVVAIPGDKVEVIAGKGIFVNGEKQLFYAEEPNYNLRKMSDIGITGFTTSKSLFPADQREIVVPPASYFVLGDNINNAMDSHGLGFVVRKDVLAKFVRIVSRDPATGGDDPRYAE